ncbi:hypothetical protein BH10PAT3_BH10PAT3_4250 [soil metagenome]
MENSEVEKAAVKRPFYRHDPTASIIVVILVFFVSQVVAGVIVSVYPSLKNWTSDQGSAWLQNSVVAQFFYILLAEFFSVWIVLMLLKAQRIVKARIGLVRPALHDVVYALGGYVAYFAAYLAIIIIASRFSDFINVDQAQKVGFESAAGGQLGLVFLSLVVLPPIAEEIMFRGFLFTSLRQKFRFRSAAIFTSLLFGIAHLQFGSGAPLLWVAALDTFTLSVVLCYLREKTGSLWPSIMLHAIKNSVAFFALYHLKF